MAAAPYSQQQVFSNEDLSSDIMSRLPCKYAITCRCVCKAWRALISHPLFVKKHNSRFVKSKSSFVELKLLMPIPPYPIQLSVEYPILSVDYEALLKHANEQGVHAGSAHLKGIPRFNYEISAYGHPFNGYQVSGQFARELRYPLRSPMSSFNVYGSCHGLICVASDHENIILWNPSTGDSELVPDDPPIRHKSGRIIEEADFFGFGYDSTTEDYKIIRCYQNVASKSKIARPTPRSRLFEVFTLKTGSWRQDYVDSMDCGVYTLGQGCLANEAVHWIDVEDYCREHSSISPQYPLAIVSFNLVEEKFQRILPTPKFQSVGGTIRAVEIGSFEDCLVLYLHSKMKAALWVMKEYGVEESWTELFNFNPLLDFFADKIRVINFRPLCILKNGEVLLVANGNVLTLYDPKGRTFRALIDTYTELTSPTIYAETLVSPVIGSGTSAGMRWTPTLLC